MDSFPWNSLPTEIQRYILSLLPVSTLIACTSVSSSLCHTIRSENFTSSYKRKSAEVIFFFQDTCVAYNSSSDRWFSLLYDSVLDQWRSAGEIPNLDPSVESTVFMEDTGLFYGVGTTRPACILTLDITAASDWTILKLGMPAPTLLDLHLFRFSCRLFLAAAVERNGSIVGVCIWELDRAAMKWSVACSMPDEHFATFSAGNLRAFHTINCGRVVCFYYSRKNHGESMMMCDVLEKRWWRPRQCPFPRDEWYSLQAVEPCIDLVWGSN